MRRQTEFCNLGQVFNLACECGADGARLIRERDECARRERESKAFVAKCQKTFEQCPGFVGAEAPAGHGRAGLVVVEPSQLREAMDFLRRRFHVNADGLRFDASRGLCVPLVAKAKRVSGKRAVRVNFAKPVQYELSL